MSKNINSFSQNINQVVKQQANELARIAAVQKSMTTNDTFVTYDYEDESGQTIRYQLPSYEAVMNRLRAVEESIMSLNNGRGAINLQDGSRRTLQLSSIPHTPDQITGLENPSTFTVDGNWFFEDFMYPGAQVEINLTGQIEDTADRVRVVRVILDANNSAAQTIWENDLSVNSYDYVSLKTLLSDNGVPYYEDEETVQLPLVSNQVNGYFQITEDPIVSGGNVWYQLDSIDYQTISPNGIDQGRNNVLSKGDHLAYQDTIFQIVEIDQTKMQVRLQRTSGVQSPGAFAQLTFFQDPFRDKTVKIRFGAHEYDIIYFKGVAEQYNLLGDTWSTPVRFSSDELVLKGSVGLRETPFAEYYYQYIFDWGRNMIDEVRDRKLSAWSGQIPNVPVLNVDDFRVVQINTQINAAIDTTDVKNTAAEIESVKSQISSLKRTIAAQKTDLQATTDLYQYNSIQNQISTNVTDLSNLQTTYSTLVDSFQSMVRENSAITTDPKYHIRGFFPVPEFKYRDNNEIVAEEIIGFDVAYRYIREDSTATQLNTFKYTDDNGTEYTGTFTDWVIKRGPMKEKVRDEELMIRVWKAENTADGTETNINQIDIPISKGEKVEFKVRSISEAGYPGCPLTSEWSNSVVVSFPPTLSTTNEMADLIKKINDDALTITIQNNLESEGLITHIDDTVPNTNSVNGIYFKHLAKNIAYEETAVDEAGITTVHSISIQDKISQIFTQLDETTRLGHKNASLIDDVSNRVYEWKITQDENNASVDVSLKFLRSQYDDTSATVRSIYDSSTDTLRANRFVLRTLDSKEYKVAMTFENDEVYIGAPGTEDSSVYPVHVNDLYLHEDADSNHPSFSLIERLYEHGDRIAQNEEDVIIINSSVTEMNASLATKATKPELLDVSYIANAAKRATDAITSPEENTNDWYELYVKKLHLQYGTTITDEAGDGQLQIFGGSGGFGAVYLDEVMFDNATQSLKDLWQDTDDVSHRLNQVEEHVDKIDEDLYAVFTVEGTQYTATLDNLVVNNIDVNGALRLNDTENGGKISIGSGKFEPKSMSGTDAVGQFDDIILTGAYPFNTLGEELSNLTDNFGALDASIHDNEELIQEVSTRLAAIEVVTPEGGAYAVEVGTHVAAEVVYTDALRVTKDGINEDGHLIKNPQYAEVTTDGSVLIVNGNMKVSDSTKGAGDLTVTNDLSVGGTVRAEEFLYPLNGQNASLGESVMDCCTLCSSINKWLGNSFGNYSKNSFEGTLEVNYQSIKVGETDGCLLRNNYDTTGQKGLEVNGNFDIERDCHIKGNFTVDGSIYFPSKTVVVGDIIIGTQSLRDLLDRWLGINGGDVPNPSNGG